MNAETTLIVWSNLADEARAREIAVVLVREALAACVHVFPKGTSYYLWEGDLHGEEEWTLMMKTRQGRYAALERRLRQLHPYQTPEILATPVVAGLSDYLAWVDASTRST